MNDASEVLSGVGTTPLVDLSPRNRFAVRSAGGPWTEVRTASPEDIRTILRLRIPSP